MSIETVAFYDERRDLALDVVSVDRVRQLARMTWRLLRPDIVAPLSPQSPNHQDQRPGAGHDRQSDHLLPGRFA
jgi:hypothetical protein